MSLRWSSFRKPYIRKKKKKPSRSHKVPCKQLHICQERIILLAVHLYNILARPFQLDLPPHDIYNRPRIPPLQHTLRRRSLDYDLESDYAKVFLDAFEWPELAVTVLGEALRYVYRSGAQGCINVGWGQRQWMPGRPVLSLSGMEGEVDSTAGDGVGIW